MKVQNFFKSTTVVVFTTILLSFLSVLPSAHADTLKLGLNPGNSAFENTSDLPKPVYLGMATLANGVRVPAYQVFDQDMDMVYGPSSLYIDKKLDAAYKTQVAVYYFHYQWFLIPKNWRLISANIGMGGRAWIVFAPPKGQKGYFQWWINYGGCERCVLSFASYFFKQADILNQREYGAKSRYLDISPKISFVSLDRYTKAWRATVEGQQVDGVAYFNPDEDLFAMDVSVSLPKAQRKLATPILNWRLIK
ncbi:DUF4850 domain-containing protein [Moraxella sp. ZJ142]|uniref:DUF4850 domain-containing protein n=1 Tax=Moraxella marmotae TaxID=3344520 RepID=UPI0035D4E354